MKLWCSAVALVSLFLAAGAARADVSPDPCSMGAAEGAACTTLGGKPGTCVAPPSGGALYCKETSASGSGGGGGGGGAGGAGGSGTGGDTGSGGSPGPDVVDEDSGCSLRAVGSAGAAGGAAVAMIAAGALLMRRRRR